MRLLKQTLLKLKLMKTVQIIFTLSAFVLFAACMEAGIPPRTIRGDRNVVTVERPAGEFTGISVSSGIDVFLSQGNTPAISVEADENLQDVIVTEIRNGVLHVYTEYNIIGAEKKCVYVTTPQINSVQTSSAGDIIGETPVVADMLRLSASSAGDIELEVRATEVDADISSSGNIILSGEADILRADISSAGDLKAFELIVRDADVSTSSAGDAEVNVSEKLRARASSAGSINYTGDVSMVDANSSSAGGVHRK